LNITKHIKERYVERIIGITTKQELQFYIGQNSEKITEHIMKIYENAEYLWTGQIGDNVTRHYYIANDIVLVANTNNDALITLYKVDFDFPDKTNKMIVKDLKIKIQELSDKYNNEVSLSKDLIDKNKERVEILDLEVVVINKQLDLLKHRKVALMEENKEMLMGQSITKEELKKYISRLVNSKEYREDIKNIIK
jgi:hypothetical protein